MPKKIKLLSGAYEIVDTDDEKNSKAKHKAKKKPADLTDGDVKELIWEIAKKLNML